MSEEDAYRVFGIRNFRDFWRTNSHIAAYRVCKDDGKVYVEFEGDKGKIMSYLFVGAFAYHLKRIRVVTDELETIETELNAEAAIWRRRNTQENWIANTVATEVEVQEVQEEDEEEDEGEEPPRKKRKLFWGICRKSEYDPETMEPYPRCGDRLKKRLNEKGLVAYLLKDHEEEPNSEDDAHMTPTGMMNTYENVYEGHDYENTFNVSSDY
jgi:hypothetical protein